MTPWLACDLDTAMIQRVWRMMQLGSTWLILLGGWVLGIVGFYRANRALKEIAALRARLAGLSAAAPSAEPVAPPASPWSAPPAAPAEPAPEPVRETVRPDLEVLLTQRWGVWLGAIALLLAGVFLVRYAAEQGLLGPAGRCFGAAMLGFALLAGAEGLRRRPPPVLAGRFGPDQAPAALAAGGAAMLFAAAYGVAGFYGLVPPAVGFVLMALAAMAGLVVSLRFGQLAAAIGLAGAFATPALVASTEPSVALLFFYLLVVTAACLAVMRWTAWTWLGWAASAGGAVWVLFAAGLRPGGHDAWAIGLFVPAAVGLNLALLPEAALASGRGRAMAWLPPAALGVALLGLFAIRPETPFQAGLFLLGPVTMWVGARDARLDRLPWLAAGLGVLSLLVWRLPAWQPTGEAVTVEGIARAWLPGDWAPEAIIPFLLTAVILAGLNAAAGRVLERRAARPIVWAALTAGVPVVAMAVAYARVARFQADAVWGAGGLVLAGGLVFTTHLAVREGDLRRAGAHAAGAAGALALACAMVLHDHWLTLALAAFLPALAVIEARTDLAALRRVALGVAGLVLLRLIPNFNVLFYPFGTMPVLNGLIAAYALPAAAFAAAGVMFRRRGDDLLVQVLEGGAVTLLAAFVALEIRHAATGGALLRPGSFSEGAFNLLFLATQARIHLALARRTGRMVLVWAWRIEGAVSLLIAILLLLGNPAFDGRPAGAAALAAAYLLPALLVATTPTDLPGRRLLGLYAVVAIFVWIGVQVRLLFHPTAPGLFRGGITDAEMWSWSGGWLAYGVVLLAFGMWRRRRDLRQAGLAVVGLAAAKVFLLDMAGLGGLWRVLAFLGLGLTLIGLGAAYRRFVLPPGSSPP